jgi:hypothetical protein
MLSFTSGDFAMIYPRALIIFLAGIGFITAPARADLFQRHGDGKLFKYDGNGQCSNTACPGWLLIDQNAATQDVADGFGALYQLHKDGQIWRYDNRGQCTATACPGWTQVDKNPATKAIAGGPSGFYQRHADGEIWKYGGHGQCTANLCTDWTLIDKNPSTRDIVAANGTLFQRHQDGQLFRYDGRGQCSAAACPGWTLIDRNAQTSSIAGASGGFYQRHGDGQIWKYDGSGQCSNTACPGWTQIDKNAATQTIAAGGRELYQLQSDGKVWKYDGRGACSATACPGWTLIDKNAATREISANEQTVFQRHADGELWKYDGRGQCSNTACPGWTQIDKNGATVSVAAIESTPNGPVLGDLVGGSVVAAFQAEQDSTNKVVLEDRTALSQAGLCGQVLMPAPPTKPLTETILSAVAEQLSHTPFHMRSDSHVNVAPCSAHAELQATGSPNLRILIRLPQNQLDLFLTTPDVHVLGVSLGAPGSVDPHAIYRFDIEVDAVVAVPQRSGTPLRVENAKASVTNGKLSPKNVTADATVALNGLVAFITGEGFLKHLTDNRSLVLDDFGNSLTRFNAALNQVPPNVPLVIHYDRGPQTLVIRTAR